MESRSIAGAQDAPCVDHMAGAEGTVSELGRQLARDGFARIPAWTLESLLTDDALQDRNRFAESWSDLPRDSHMGDGGTYRRRRFAVFAMNGSLERLPHRPHYQSRDHNPLNGGIERWFAPVTDEDGLSPLLRGLLQTMASVISVAEGERERTVEVHQFRIEAEAATPGQPTPEGMHRDGVDWVFMMLVDRRNVTGGESEIQTPGGEALARFTLRQPFEAVLLDDRRLVHGATPVARRDPDLPASRDMLVVTFRPAQSNT